MPDFFEDREAEWDWYDHSFPHFLRLPHRSCRFPDDTPEKTQKLEDFLAGPANTERAVEKVTRVHVEAQSRFPSVEKWGIVGTHILFSIITYAECALGYCWGGWVSSYCSEHPAPFSAVAQLHPGFVGQTIAEKIRIPLFVICSKDETDEQAQTFMGHLSPDIAYKHYVRFGDMDHGWLSARGDLTDPAVRKAYEEGYRLVLNFFHKHL